MVSQVSRVAASIQFTRTAAPDGGQTEVDQSLSLLLNLASGTSAGKADLGFCDYDRSVASNSSADFDFVGSLVDALGLTISAAKIKALMIKANAANTTTLTFGGATNEWQGFFGAAGDKLVLRAGESFLIHSDTGWACAAGSTDALKVANSTGAAGLFDIAFLAVSA